MAMSVVYATINGQIVSENRGGVISYYAPDNLGSTVALLDATGTVTDTFTYWPYGEIQSHVGSSVTPFTFCGTLGYYLDVLGSQIYVRARCLRQALARWQSLDPLWPRVGAYSYVSSSPVADVDPSGMAGLLGLLGRCGLGALNGIGGLISTLIHGGPINGGALFCSLGPPCIAAILALLVADAFPPATIALGCLAGAIGNIAASLITTFFCNPPNPCKPVNSALCDILNSLVSGLTGCLSGFIPPQGVQIIIKVGLGIINKFFGSEALKGCMGNPPGGSGPGLVGF